MSNTARLSQIKSTNTPTAGQLMTANVASDSITFVDWKNPFIVDKRTVAPQLPSWYNNQEAQWEFRPNQWGDAWKINIPWTTSDRRTIETRRAWTDISTWQYTTQTFYWDHGGEVYSRYGLVWSDAWSSFSNITPWAGWLNSDIIFWNTNTLYTSQWMVIHNNWSTVWAWYKLAKTITFNRSWEYRTAVTVYWVNYFLPAWQISWNLNQPQVQIEINWSVVSTATWAYTFNPQTFTFDNILYVWDIVKIYVENIQTQFPSNNETISVSWIAFTFDYSTAATYTTP